MRILPLLVAVALASVRPATPAPAKSAALPTLVLLVRHAEKSAEPAGDPALTAAGVERAKALAAALEDAGVTAIVTSQFRRTRDTAAPLAQALGLKPEAIEAKQGEAAAHIEAVVAAVRRHPGEVVLVVGHANTVPAIVAALGGPKMHDLQDTEYSDLFALVPGSGSGKARLVKSRYGAADPAPAEAAHHPM
jgi:phosphohistidine phosphatase SixA